jgi:hypothetical protein
MGVDQGDGAVRHVPVGAADREVPALGGRFGDVGQRIGGVLVAGGGAADEVAVLVEDEERELVVGHLFPGFGPRADAALIDHAVQLLVDLVDQVVRDGLDRDETDDGHGHDEQDRHGPGDLGSDRHVYPCGGRSM